MNSLSKKKRFCLKEKQVKLKYIFNISSSVWQSYFADICLWDYGLIVFNFIKLLLQSALNDFSYPVDPSGIKKAALTFALLLISPVDDYNFMAGWAFPSLTEQHCCFRIWPE